MSTTGDTLTRTPLYDVHLKYGAKMVPFCGWSMPVEYANSKILESHLHTRKHAGLFDVSHMGQLHLHGKDRVALLERLTVGDFQSLGAGKGRLSLFTNEKGGTLDDLVATNAGDYFYVVVNAGCKDDDITHMQEHIKQLRSAGKDVHLEIIDDHALVALQGPSAMKVLQGLVKPDLSLVEFMTSQAMEVAGVPCRVTRCGYTGEDGFEISVPAHKSVQLTEQLLSHPDVKPVGLGARDSLRLEAGLCLYGHELSPEISPIEAGLAWTIGKRRREQGGFLGADVILHQLKNGTSRKRVGLLVQGAPARDGCGVVVEGQPVGTVTSGGFSPSLNRPIAQAYIRSDLATPGTPVQVIVRGKAQAATVSKMPLVPTNYFKPAPKP
eukprot:CAMPEP_0196665236 /NCGR_PEP_ID=MMETSP1086-20130531/60078_1 /TAXON_ID=77921 /ORGANISM="Cyanoptyche  gloeocystis , Strain SAG4.97" /LENGTH=380 /DNA_ID=CAMNT_0042001879 /DNA_START=113 /DNA_END=1255 /DNA_ORIENTATION=+